jgi:hypothetical protein
MICIIYIVYVTILTIYNCLNARRFHLHRWWLRMWFFLLQCCVFINSSSYTPINWAIYWFLLFTLPLSTCPWIGGQVLPILTPLHRGVFYQSSNIMGYKVSSLVNNWAFKDSRLVINLQVRDTSDCLGLLSETLHGQFVDKCNQVGLYERAFCKI